MNSFWKSFLFIAVLVMLVIAVGALVRLLLKSATSDSFDYTEYELETQQEEVVEPVANVVDEIPTFEDKSMKVILRSGSTYRGGEPINFPSFNNYLSLQGDGNLVLYHGSPGNGQGAIWSANSVAGTGNYSLELTNRGNLMIHKGAKDGSEPSIIYNTAYNGKKGKYFFGIKDDILSVNKGSGPEDSDSEVVWSNFRTHLKVGQRMLSGEMLRDFSRNAYIVLQGGGNLVCREGRDIRSKGTVYWASGSSSGGESCFLAVEKERTVIYSGTVENPIAAIWTLDAKVNGGTYHIRINDYWEPEVVAGEPR